MTKRELYDIINEEIVNFKKGTINEELNESDKDLIRKIIRQEVSEIFFELFKKRKTWGDIMSNLLIETRLFEGRVNEDESGRTIVKGILQRAKAENQNGRIYPKPILMRETKNTKHLLKKEDIR